MLYAAAVINIEMSLLLSENFVYFVIGYHFFLEHISSCLGRLYNFNHLGIGTTLTFLYGCDGFLCHGFLLFNFFVNGYSSQNGVVFFQLQTLSGVFSVFGGNITRHTGQTTIFLFGAFENYLYSITFCFLCHVQVLLNLSVQITFAGCLFEGCVQTDFVDSAETGSRYTQVNPAILFYPIELFRK